jgi:hypothetical protein
MDKNRYLTLDSEFFAFPDNLTDLLFDYVSHQAVLSTDVTREGISDLVRELPLA